MIRTELFEVWNLSPGVEVQAEAQTVFNIVGRVLNPSSICSFSYELNGGPRRPVWFRKNLKYEVGRLWRPGDFNIDTINAKELARKNEIAFYIKQEGRKDEANHRVAFRTAQSASSKHRFRLDLTAIQSVEEVAQVVDGRWTLGRNRSGTPFLEIDPSEAGYDRILLFGRHDWTTGYEVRALLEPTAWTSRHHNLGLVFKWNPHLQGNGTHLPTQWSTGLGYYCSYTPGLRLRFGTNVHIDENGRKIGDHVLMERAYSPLRRVGYRILNNVARLDSRLSQLPSGYRYHFRLIVTPDRYALCAWRDGRREPAPQLEIASPEDLLPIGAVGIIALCCGVRLYEFEVIPR